MVTIRDVAVAAGVSTQTVSRVINRKGYVGDAPRRRVEEAIQRLGYIPNRVASSMVTGRTMSIGIVVPDVSSAYFSEVVLGAETVASKAGYTLVLCDSAESPEQEKRILRFLHEARVDGVIMASARLSHQELLQVLADHKAFVTINHPVPPELGGSVWSDHIGGMALAVQHLVRSGRRTIAFMAGAENSFTGRERLRGFVQAMREAGRQVDPGLIVPYTANFEAGCRTLYEWLQSADAGAAHWSEVHAQFGVRGARALLGARPDVDAIVCNADQLAFGVLRACAELGRRVPDDVAVVGCNDVPLASLVTPALTTQRIPRYQMGAAAARMLIERIEGREEQGEIVFAHELVVRESAPGFQTVPVL